MTIQRHQGKLYVECDTCGDEYSRNEDGNTTKYSSDEWDVMISDIREAGWTWQQKPKSKEWEHTCPDCQ